MVLRGSVYSKTLGMDSKITVVFPDRYRHNQSFKVVYLLHGLMSDSDGWVDHTLLPLYAQEHETVVILPTVNRSLYVDMKYGHSYFTYVAKELPQICKTLFNISDKREDTAVIGGSMGGYGALKCAFTFPERYSYCAALAPGGMYLAEHMDNIRGKLNLNKKLHRDFAAAFGENLVCKEADNLLELAKQAVHEKLPLTYYCACGLQDEYLPVCRRFNQDMRNMGLPFMYEEMPGGHDWRFFNEALGRSLDVWGEQ